MKSNLLRKWIVAALALALLMNMSLGALAQAVPGAGRAERETLTLGQVADFFTQAADDYHPASRDQVLRGFDENRRATRLEMFVLASRAFGQLAAPAGNGRYTAPAPVDVSAAPAWAREALENLSRGGVLAASDLGLSPLEGAPEARGEEAPRALADGAQANTDAAPAGAACSPGPRSAMEDHVTRKDAQILAQRFFQAFGAHLKDNFYAAVNKAEMDALQPAGEGVGGFSSVAAQTQSQLRELILEIAASDDPYPKGSPRQKIRDLYASVLALDQRDAAGLTPLREYLDAVDAARNFSELNDAVAMAVERLGNFANGLFPMVAVADVQDSSRKVMQLLSPAPMFLAADYADAGNEMVLSYRDDIAAQLRAAGESAQEARRHADGLLLMERALAESASSYEQLQSFESQARRYTPGDLDRMMPEATPSRLLEQIGLGPGARMQAFDDKQFAAYAAWFTEENLDLIKSIQKIALISGFSGFLSQELAAEFSYEPTDPQEAASAAVESFLGDELGQLYVERYFSAESKAEIEKMVRLMIDAFEARIGRLDWMEESTKAEAVKKLQGITVLIGYPDSWELNGADIKGVAEGGSYFFNAAASEADKWRKMVSSLDEPVDPRRFSLTAFTVNAAASRNTNTLIFPAGILQAPIYDKDASFETNLGAIGSIIAHEITHMFDDGGAQYDATGTARLWWQEGDYAHFQALCEKTEAFYHGYEAAPGIPADGKATLSENIADIGGVACALEVLSHRENADYDAFFRSYARYHIKVASYETLKELSETDEHAPNILRCNRVLSNFQEFFDTYGIGPGDGMYVAPEERVVIW